jgi:hypothetical protein
MGTASVRFKHSVIRAADFAGPAFQMRKSMVREFVFVGISPLHSDVLMPVFNDFLPCLGIQPRRQVYGGKSPDIGPMSPKWYFKGLGKDLPTASVDKRIAKTPGKTTWRP